MNKRFRYPDTLSTWLRTALGQSLIRAENECLQELLPGLFGPVAVQVGDAGFHSYIKCSGAVFCYAASMIPPGIHSDAANLYCIPEQLPFEAKSVGLVILPHVLEFSDYPHQILREVERVLVPEGHLVVLGFNPVSMWGLASVFRSRRMPWNGRFATLGRMKDWLALLNFELTAGRMLYHKPPVQSERIRKHFGFLEKAGDRWWPLGAAVYAVTARKRRVGVTPLHPEWRKHSKLQPGLARPFAGARVMPHGRVNAG